MSESLKILLVDDEPMFREMVQVKLRVNVPGAKFVHAVSGNNAIRIIEDDPEFRLIVCDYQMPDGNGFEFVEYLIQRKLKIPVIIFTSMVNLKLPFPEGHPVIAIVEKVHLEEMKEIVLMLIAPLKRKKDDQ